MAERIWCWPLYTKLNLKDIYTYLDNKNGIFYHTWEIDDEAKDIIWDLIISSWLDPNKIELKEVDISTIHKMYWD